MHLLWNPDHALKTDSTPVDTCRYPMLPVDTCRYPMLPVDTNRYPMLPVDTSRYPMLPVAIGTLCYLYTSGSYIVYGTEEIQGACIEGNIHGCSAIIYV